MLYQLATRAACGRVGIEAEYRGTQQHQLRDARPGEPFTPQVSQARADPHGAGPGPYDGSDPPLFAPRLALSPPYAELGSIDLAGDPFPKWPKPRPGLGWGFDPVGGIPHHLHDPLYTESGPCGGRIRFGRVGLVDVPAERAQRM